MCRVRIGTAAGSEGRAALLAWQRRGGQGLLQERVLVGLLEDGTAVASGEPRTHGS